jgi:PKD repeat protein
MKTIYSTIAGLFLLCSSTQLFAQSGTTPVNGMNPKVYESQEARKANPSDPNTPQDGSTFLGPAYQYTACGLNYTTATQKLGQRLSTSCCPSTNGVPQPATFTISGIPVGATIVKAFVWCDASGNGAPVTLTVVNPTPTPFNIPMTVVGGDVDKCWGYSGVFTYRADVTAAMTGNGNYQLSGFPVDPGAATHTNDVDGATMVVIYTQPAAGFQGTIVIWDGAVVKLGTSTTQTMSNFKACPTGNISNARGFAAFGDLQTLNSGIIINGMPPFPIVEDWWNFVDVPTTVATGQNTAVFGNNQNNGDCYNFCLMGLYYQDDCNHTSCDVPCVAKAVITSSGCNPIVFSGSNSGSTPITSWYWDFGDGQNSTLPNPSHTYALAGTYKVCLTITAVSPSGGSCCDQACTKVVACGPQPCVSMPYFKWENSPQFNTVNFFDYSTGTGTECAWFWDFGDGNTSTLQNPTHTYAGPGFYYVCLKTTYCVYDADGNLVSTCTEVYCTQVPVGIVIPNITSPKNQSNSDGSSGTSNGKKAMVYPNPASSEIFVVAQEDLQPTVRVLNSTGQEMTIAQPSAKNLYKINLEHIAPGLYTIEIVYTDGTAERLPFVKD